MRATVREKLARLDEVFPPERLARSQARWTRLWHGDALLDRLPFVYAPLGDYYVAGHTPEALLQSSLDEFIARGCVDDDFIPAFFPGCHQGTIPNMFGAAPRELDGDYTCDRLIYHLEDIDALPAPSPASGTVAGEWLAMQQYLLEETEGRIPIHVTDMQGPVDVCGQMWGYDNLFEAAYDDPDRYHALLDRVTDAFILFWSRQQELLGEAFVGTHLFGWSWVPADAGASLSADSLVMVSPAFYEEFYQPYLVRIGECFGGLAVHSCGDFAAVARAVCATPTVRAVNAGQMTVAQLVDAGVDGHTLIIAIGDITGVADTFALARTRGLRIDLTLGGLWPTANGKIISPTAWTAADRNTIRARDAQVQEMAAGVMA